MTGDTNNSRRNEPGFKRVPEYWWDFEKPGILPIIVESDDPRLPKKLAAFHGADAIERAERLIEDLKAGRIDPRRLPRVTVEHQEEPSPRF